MPLRIRVIVTASLAVVSPHHVFGQPPASAPASEVASIRPTDPRQRQGIDMHTFPSGSLEATNVTLKQMIEAAYNFKPYLVCGGPAWKLR
jgi:hypothetical protein